MSHETNGVNASSVVLWIHFFPQVPSQRQLIDILERQHEVYSHPVPALMDDPSGLSALQVRRAKTPRLCRDDGQVRDLRVHS